MLYVGLAYLLFVIYGSLVPLDFRFRPLTEAWQDFLNTRYLQLGVQAAIGFIRNTLTGPWLDPREIEQRLSRPFRLCLV